MSFEPLAAEFPTPTYEEWEQLVRAKDSRPDRSGPDTARELANELEEGLEVKWIYTPADQLAQDPGGLPGTAPFTRGTRVSAPWAIRQRTAVTGDDQAARDLANRQILEDLEGGATAVLLAPESNIASVDQLDEVLTGVLLDMAAIALDWGGRPDSDTAAHLLELWRRRGHAAHEIKGSLRLDSIDMLKAVRQEFPEVRVVAVDTTRYADRGAGAVYELALGLADATRYLREADSAGIAAAELAAALEFTMAVGPDQFLEIAKLRAARRLWANVLEHCGVPAEQRRSDLYVQTSRRMVSSLDPWVNLLRGTSATFAGAVGGADGVTVRPFDEPYAETFTEGGPLGRRMARNTQLILAEESNIYRVADPAGGSFYVESLTDRIAQRAWAEFQQIEAAGGISVDQVEQRLGAASQARHEQIARRRQSLTGVNQFPLLGDDGLVRDERQHAVAEAVASKASASTTNVEGTAERAEDITRDAAQFEALRARAAQADPAPRLLLACAGTLAQHVSAAQWAKNFFEAGGVETVQQTEEQLNPAGFRAAAVVVGKEGDPGPILARLQEAGIGKIYAVGTDLEGAERVKDGVDMVAVLSELLERLS